MAEESGALRLSPIARDLPSAQFMAGGRVQVDLLAETLRGIVGTATEELGEHPGSVEVSYPASWDSRQLLLLWEALVLAGIPDAATRPVTDPLPAPLVQVSPVDNSETPTEVFSAPGVPAQAPAEVAAAVPATFEAQTRVVGGGRNGNCRRGRAGRCDCHGYAAGRPNGGRRRIDSEQLARSRDHSLSRISHNHLTDAGYRRGSPGF